MRDALNLSGVAAEFNAGELIPADKMADPLRLFCEEFMPAFRQGRGQARRRNGDAIALRQTRDGNVHIARLPRFRFHHCG